MPRKFCWILFIGLLATTQIQAQNKSIDDNGAQIFLRQPNTLINDYTLPLELAKQFVIKGKVRGERKQVLQDVTVKLVSLAKNKVEKKLAYNPKTGTFQGAISHTGTYLVLIKKKGYTFHTEYVRVEDKTYTKARVIETTLNKHQK
ncbi:MAG TPA: hypothetical protein DCS93_07310 [Microscillaceae bacterium]|nr:hypothetical protein [Microscillaceae bacterium]